MTILYWRMRRSMSRMESGAYLIIHFYEYNHSEKPTKHKKVCSSLILIKWGIGRTYKKDM